MSQTPRVRTLQRLHRSAACASLLMAMSLRAWPEARKAGEAEAMRFQPQESRLSQPWTPFSEFAPDALKQDLFGHPSEGPAFLFVWFRSSYSLPYHRHIGIERIYLDKGMLEIHYYGHGAMLLRPGESIRIPGGAVHSLTCASSDDCYFYWSSDKRFTLSWYRPPMPRAGKTNNTRRPNIYPRLQSGCRCVSWSMDSACDAWSWRTNNGHQDALAVAGLSDRSLGS